MKHIQAAKDMNSRRALLSFALLAALVLNSSAVTHYVDLNSPSPTPPYTNWLTAATNIQDAVDAAVAGDAVLVTNGVYATGGRTVVPLLLKNRVAVDKPLILMSVNGPQMTVIKGSLQPGGINGDFAVRCVYLDGGASLIGFTLTNGATRAAGDGVLEQSGGGLWCNSPNAMGSNCVVTGNSAALLGGGAYSGTLTACTIIGNRSAYGGGSWGGSLSGCSLSSNTATLNGGGAVNSSLTNCSVNGNTAKFGGGTYESILNDCTVSNNFAVNQGGGISGGVIYDSMLGGNSSSNGGGAAFAFLIDCTLAANAAFNGGGSYSNNLKTCTLSGNWATNSGGGSFGDTATNCIIVSNSAAASGGGSYKSALKDCTVTHNLAGNSGGGAREGSLKSCFLRGNLAFYGAGTYAAALNNCTLTGNSALGSGGGAYQGAIANCILYFNKAVDAGDNYVLGSLNSCCTTPLPGSGQGNINSDPLLSSSSHISAGSPCVGAGNAFAATGTDIDGDPWASPPTIGCDEFSSVSATGALNVAISAAYTNVAVGFLAEFVADIIGPTTGSVWDFGDGTVVSNRLVASHAWSVPGDYLVTLTAFNASWPSGVGGAVLVQVRDVVYYVSAMGNSPVPPYTNWLTAATNIQDAVDAVSAAGAVVLVTNGIYSSGGKAVFGALTNRVAVDKPLRLLSVNGPDHTFIQGFQLPGTTNGIGAIRCVYLTNGAGLSGFTLTNGATLNVGEWGRERSGGGLYCESTNAWASNCVLIANSAERYGGGAHRGYLARCRIQRNSAYGGGGGATAYNGGTSAPEALILLECSLSDNWGVSGGGSYEGVIINCILSGNSANNEGGGATRSTLFNCSLANNSAQTGGGASFGTLDSCTVVGNVASGSGGGVWGGGNWTNCILYYNSATSGPNYLIGNASGPVAFCCTTPMPLSGRGAVGNITNAPSFVDTNGWSNMRLQTGSPSINAGNNAFVTSSIDLAGNPRISGGTVDMGAYEFQSPASVLSYAWAQRNGLPTDGSVDFTDADGDGANNWQEWRADTSPTNAASALLMGTATNGMTSLVVSWASVATRSYWLERGTDLSAAAPFQIIASNITGVAGTKTYNDTSATNGGPYFYRVGVQ